MRTTIAIDDELIAKAREFTDLTETTALVREGLKALIAREGARRLILLGGTDPDARAAPRRRSMIGGGPG
ncbi:MAG: type II toxin-antitoxin system VapB family antitoxin [Stellaceae bacterium]